MYSARCNKLLSSLSRHISGFSPEPSEHLEVLVHVLEVALHRRKHILQKGIISAVKEMNRYVDAFLLGYGLCGNALSNPAELLDVDVVNVANMRHVWILDKPLKIGWSKSIEKLLEG